MALPLLCHKIRHDYYSERIVDFTSDGATVPRSLRVKFELTCSEQEVLRTDEFRTLTEESQALTKKWQIEMRQIILKTKELDRQQADKKFKESFSLRPVLVVTDSDFFFRYLYLYA